VPAQQADTAIDIRRFPWIRKLAADYVFNFGGVAPFFSGNPADKSAWTAAIAGVRAQPRDLPCVMNVLRAQQGRRSAPERAREAAAKLADPAAVAIVTGQQAGLFGGPLFTLFKAITALKLAERLTREHQTNAVAVFWVEGEDHDWNEVRSCTVLDESLAPKTISLPENAAPENTPVARITLDDSVRVAIDELEQSLPATEFRASLVASLRAAYATGSGMADAFAKWLERVLGDRGLVVFDASDPAAKPLAGPVFSRELVSPGETIKRAATAGEGLTSRGYHSQVQAADGGVALFRMGDARRPLRQQNGAFVAGEETFASDALLREARECPAAFSPNVLLRPIVQDTVFPTVAYVAGPNELAYLGQLKSVYEYFGVPMPLMFPRASATLLDSPALRFLQKYQVPLETLQAQDEAALNQLLKAQIPPAIEESFDAAGRAIEDRIGRVASALGALDPTLEGAAKSTLGRMQHDLDTLHGKTIQAAKRRDDTLRRQFLRTRALAFPGGHPQERAIGFVSFLNQYGPALVDRLFDELPLDLGSHWIVSI
jgi:bacillithiol synthase